LKYRTAQIEGETEAQLGQAGGARFGAQIRNYALIAEDGKYALDDGIQAIKVVRAHAAEWGVFSGSRRLHGILSWRNDHRVYGHPAGCERASELRRSDLRRLFSYRASDTERRATLFHGDGGG
jgi:hypothetical protein